MAAGPAWAGGKAGMPAYLVCVAVRGRAGAAQGSAVQGSAVPGGAIPGGTVPGEAERAMARQRLEERIRSRFKSHWHSIDSTWIVQTEMNASQIRDYLRPCLGIEDELLVVRSGHQAAWAGLERTDSAWLKEHL